MTADSAKLPARIVTSRAGYQRLLDTLQAAKRRYDVVCASNEEAAGAGDSSVWHDNFAYEDNQRQMHQLARRVRDLQHLEYEWRATTPSRTNLCNKLKTS